MKKFDIPTEDNVVVKENAQYTLQFTAIAPFFAIGAAVIAPFLPIFFVGLMLSIPSTL
jgi:hypothetical protein